MKMMMMMMVKIKKNGDECQKKQFPLQCSYGKPSGLSVCTFLMSIFNIWQNLPRAYPKHPLPPQESPARNLSPRTMQPQTLRHPIICISVPVG